MELQSRQQQLIAARNDYAKRKLSLARVIGLPPGQEFKLTEQAPYEPFTPMGIDQSLQRAYSTRPDYLAAQETVNTAVANMPPNVRISRPLPMMSVPYGGRNR